MLFAYDLMRFSTGGMHSHAAGCDVEVKQEDDEGEVRKEAAEGDGEVGEALGSPELGGATKIAPMCPFLEKECRARIDTHVSMFSSSLKQGSKLYGGKGNGSASVLIGSQSSEANPSVSVSFMLITMAMAMVAIAMVGPTLKPRDVCLLETFHMIDFFHFRTRHG